MSQPADATLLAPSSAIARETLSQFRLVSGDDLLDANQYYGADARFQDLLSDDGWTPITAGDGEAAMSISKKDVDGMPCLRTEVVATGFTPAELMACVADVASTPDWSTAGIGAAKLLSKQPGHMAFYQGLKVPGWTFQKNKWWAAEANTTRTADGKFELLVRLGDDAMHEQHYPALKAEFGKANKLNNMLGAWTLTPTEGGTRIRYASGADIGMRVPAMIENFVYKKMAPKAVNDAIAETRRRQQEAS